MKLAKIDKEQWDAMNDAISSCWEMWEEEGIEPSLSRIWVYFVLVCWQKSTLIQEILIYLYPRLLSQRFDLMKRKEK